MSDPGARLQGDRGQVAGIEVLPFGVLVFVVGALLIANAWAVVDARGTVDAAAREAVRAYVEAPDATQGAVAARSAATTTLAGHGRRPELAAMSISHERSLAFQRCVRATVALAYPVPALRLPWIGGLGPTFLVRAHHTERIDPFRSGLQGVGTC